MSAAPTAPANDAQQLATQLLAQWGKNLTGNPQPLSDLQATSRGESINNADTCGNTIVLDYRLLKVLLTALSKYKINLWNIVTGHGCDEFKHPEGRATDIHGIVELSTGRSSNQQDGTAGDLPALDTQFVEYLGSIAPPGSQIAQANCPGRSSAVVPPGIDSYGPDTCNHQHFNVS